MGYRALVTLVLTTHFLYLTYVVLGGFLAWRWKHAIWPHIAAVVWGVLVITFPWTCPLTAAENWARDRAGEGRTDGFIDRYVEGVIYPPQYVQLARLAVAAVILLSWWGALRRRRPAMATKPGDGAPRQNAGT
jgi:hypothetical protein